MSRLVAFEVVFCHCALIVGGVLSESLLESDSQLINQSDYSKAEFNQSWINFQSSVKRQQLLNSRSKLFKQSAKYGVNQFSTLSPQQFKDLYLGARLEKMPKYNYSNAGPLNAAHYPMHFDWREQGIVAPVQNQQSCGACWAFSVVSAIESMIVKNGGKMQELSVQQVIDCAYKSQGCNGGFITLTLEWLKQTGEKLVSATDYPYKAKTGICQFYSRVHAGVSVTNYAAYDFREQEDVMRQHLVDWGPLIVLVDALSWQDYLGGIIQHHCTSGCSNHAVLITGYDMTGEVPFWIVQNSWGTSWGDKGYVYVKMGENTCGIADNVATVSVMSAVTTEF